MLEEVIPIRPPEATELGDDITTLSRRCKQVRLVKSIFKLKWVQTINKRSSLNKYCHAKII